MSSSLNSKEASRGSPSGTARARATLHSCAWEEYLREVLAVYGIEVALAAGANLSAHQEAERHRCSVRTLVGLWQEWGLTTNTGEVTKGKDSAMSSVTLIRAEVAVAPLSIDHGLLQVLEYDALFVNRQQARRLVPHQ
jgi:hypothetical protein